MTSNIAIVQALYGAFSAGDAQGVRACLAPQVQWREPGYQGDGGVYAGRDAVIAHLLEGEPLVEDYRLNMVDMLSSDRRVAIVAATSGTRNGRAITNEFVQVLTVEDDLVTDVRVYVWDPQQLREFMAAG